MGNNNRMNMRKCKDLFYAIQNTESFGHFHFHIWTNSRSIFLCFSLENFGFDNKEEKERKIEIQNTKREKGRKKVDIDYEITDT